MVIKLIPNRSTTFGQILKIALKKIYPIDRTKFLRTGILTALIALFYCSTFAIAAPTSQNDNLAEFYKSMKQLVFHHDSIVLLDSLKKATLTLQLNDLTPAEEKQALKLRQTLKALDAKINTQDKYCRDRGEENIFLIN